jgi:hypothetical protein
VRKTGKEVDSVVFSLIAHAYDGAPQTRLYVNQSLIELGTQHTEMVLSSMVRYATITTLLLLLSSFIAHFTMSIVFVVGFGVGR